MNKVMSYRPYYDLCHKILLQGIKEYNRTGIDTLSLKGESIKIPLSNIGEVIISKKFVSYKTAIKELVWMLNGCKSIEELRSQNVKIWDNWVKADGTLGPIYGAQWRNFFGYDQIKHLWRGLEASINTDLKDSVSRRLIVSAWNPAQLKDMALPPCPSFFQVHLTPIKDKYKLDLQLYQRSADMFLGVPYDLFQYSLIARILTHMYKEKLLLGDLIVNYGNAHIYENHRAQVVEMLSQKSFKTVEIKFYPTTTILDLNNSDINIKNYRYAKKIKGAVAV